MPVILNIDTATDFASICLSKEGEVLAYQFNRQQKDHASFLQPAIKETLEQANLSFQQIDAIAVSNGPGSYTGLRVGLASAKGLCFAASLPLILLSTLEVMAHAALQAAPGAKFYAPMIDARRLEVFTATYNAVGGEVEKPHAKVLEPDSFDQLLSLGDVVFSGNGAVKLKNLIKVKSHTIFTEAQHSAKDMVQLAMHHYNNQRFHDLAYSEPYYLKEFYSPSHKH